MIAFLTGTIAASGVDFVTVDVGGVGYRVRVPLSTQQHLGGHGEQIRLLTTHIFRENSQELYGFLTEGEQELFERTIAVSGVGPKLALGILSGMTPEAFTHAVLANDVKALSKCPGVGRKTAERLIMELRGSLEDLELSASLAGEPAGAGPDSFRDAVTALVSLGFQHAQAATAVKSAAKALGDDAATDALVRHALRTL